MKPGIAAISPFAGFVSRNPVTLRSAKKNTVVWSVIVANALAAPVATTSANLQHVSAGSRANLLDADLEKAGERLSFCNGGLQPDNKRRTFTFSGVSRDRTAMQIDHHF